MKDSSILLDAIVTKCLWFLPDKPYLSLKYRCNMGHWIDWKNPRTFTGKLQWLKLYDRKVEYTKMVDKYAVKQYVSELIGSEHIIPTLGVWDRPEDINWDSLPNKFVLKTTHGGGGCGVVICKDKATFNKQEATKKLAKSLTVDIYASMREWPYKNVPRKVIAEKFIDAGESHTLESYLADYKFFCFNGRVEFFKVDFGRFVEHHANYYSPEGELLEFGEVGLEPDSNKCIQMPTNLTQMISIAENLSNSHPFIRVDLYNTNNIIYFGELTFFPASGFGKWTTDDADAIIGNYLRIT